jgi:hypothetical protein
MTITQFIKKLEAIKAERGNVKVVADFKSIWEHEPLKDDIAFCNVSEAVYDRIHIADEDGGIAVNKDGTERYQDVVIVR